MKQTLHTLFAFRSRTLIGLAALTIAAAGVTRAATEPAATEPAILSGDLLFAEDFEDGHDRWEVSGEFVGPMPQREARAAR